MFRFLDASKHNRVISEICMLIDSQNEILQTLKRLFVFERRKKNDKIRRRNEKIIFFEKNVFEDDDLENDDLENDDLENDDLDDDLDDDDFRNDDFEERHDLR